MKKHVVVIGLGDTGILSAMALAKKHKVTAITTKPVFLSGQELGLRLGNQSVWQREYEFQFEQFKQLDNVTVVHGKACQLDCDAKALTLELASAKQQRIEFDACLIASGVSSGFWRSGDLVTTENYNHNFTQAQNNLLKADNIAIIGAGPSAVSSAYNLKKQHPSKQVHLFFPSNTVLSAYALRTRETISKQLLDAGVNLHPDHRAQLPDTVCSGDTALSLSQTIDWQTGQAPFDADAVLWTIGNLRPNNDYIPESLLNEKGFVKVKPSLQTHAYEHIFAVGDIADTDENRSSARNAGFMIAAENIGRFLNGEKKLKKFKAPKHRWGSILGIQDNGLMIFSPAGKRFSISHFWVSRILFPVIVRRFIYKGIRKNDD